MDNLLNTAPCGFLSFDDDGKIIIINDTLLKILEYESNDLREKKIELLLSVASRIFYQTHFFPLLKMQGSLDEIYMSLRAKNGDDVPVLSNAVRQERNGQIFNDCIFVPMRTRNKYEDEILRSKKAAQEALQAKDQINAELLQIHAMLEAKQAELIEVNAILEVSASSDALTGLKNHRAFQEFLSAQVAFALDNSLPLSLLLIDIDHFKRVNDTFGHPVGDKFLHEVALILQQNSRGSDFVARYGGEEFAIILPFTDKPGALIAAEKYRSKVEAASWVEMAVTISIGVSTLSLYVKDKTLLLTTADQALYVSKKNGRNRVTYASIH